VEAVPGAFRACEQSDFVKSEFAKNLTSCPRVSCVNRHSFAPDTIGPREVRSIGIIFVWPAYFVQQLREIAVPKVLRPQIDKHAAARIGDRLHGRMQDIARWRVAHAKDVTENVAAVHADQYRIVNVHWTANCINGANTSEAQREVWLRIDGAFKGNQCEFAPGCGYGRSALRINSFDERLLSETMLNDLFDTAHTDVVLGAQRLKIRNTRHFPIGPDDLNDDSGRPESRKATQIH